VRLLAVRGGMSARRAGSASAGSPSPGSGRPSGAVARAALSSRASANAGSRTRPPWPARPAAPWSPPGPRPTTARTCPGPHPRRPRPSRAAGTRGRRAGHAAVRTRLPALPPRLKPATASYPTLLARSPSLMVKGVVLVIWHDRLRW